MLDVGRTQMKTKYLLFTFLTAVIGISMLIYPSYNRNKNSIVTVESLLKELKTNTSSLPQSAEGISMASRKLQYALGRLPEKIRKAIELSSASKFETAPEPPFREIKSENDKLIIETAQFMAALTQIQAAYETKINRLEEEISEIKKKSSPLSIELFVGVLSILSGISVVILAWRKDSREIEALKIERENLQHQKGV